MWRWLKLSPSSIGPGVLGMVNVAYNTQEFAGLGWRRSVFTGMPIGSAWPWQRLGRLRAAPADHTVGRATCFTNLLDASVRVIPRYLAEEVSAVIPALVLFPLLASPRDDPEQAIDRARQHRRG
jgi:hypothetical protein